MSDGITVLKHEIIYNGRVFTVVRDEIAHETGYHAVREVVRHDGGAVAVPLFPDGDVLLIRQLRYPMRERILELPAGKLAPGEDPIVCAERELAEETGWRAERLEHLTSMMTTPGFCSEVLHIYLATGLTSGTPALEPGEESIEVVRMPLREAVARCMTGEIADGKTITGIMLAAVKTMVLVTR